MKKRIFFGLALTAALALIVVIDREMGASWCATLVVAAAAIQAGRELMGMMGAKGGDAALLTLLGTLGLVAVRVEPWRIEDGSALVLVGAVAFLLVEATLRLQKRGEEGGGAALDAAVAGILALAYVALPLSFLVGLAWQYGSLLAAALVLVSKCGDIGGYLVGASLGRHRIMPRVSPNKSWEGSAGGLVLTILALFVLRAAGLDPVAGFEASELVLLGLLVNLATQLGDFAESMVKRCCKVKDSADLVPTFGGALDVVDSLLFAMPAVWLVLRLMS